MQPRHLYNSLNLADSLAPTGRDCGPEHLIFSHSESDFGSSWHLYFQRPALAFYLFSQNWFPVSCDGRMWSHSGFIHCKIREIKHSVSFTSYCRTSVHLTHRLCPRGTMAEITKPRMLDYSAMSPLQYPSQLPPTYYPPVPTAPLYAPIPQNPGPQPMQPVIYQPDTNNQKTMMALGASQAPPVISHSDHMCWSIFNMLCCCFLLGIVAIIFSCKTQSAKLAGDQRVALLHSRTARNLNILCLVLGIIIYIAIPILIFVPAYTDKYHY